MRKFCFLALLILAVVSCGKDSGSSGGSNQKALVISASGIKYLSECEVAPGWKYYIYGTGFESGDRLLLGGSSSYNCEASYSNGCLVATLPSNLQSGTYTMTLLRGTSKAQIGSVNFEVSSDAVLPTPEVVAHRGYHSSINGSVFAEENSVEALANAQNLGVYGSEFDVQISDDGSLLVKHDDLVDGEVLPTLEEFLDQGLKKPSTKLVLEFKEQNTTTQERNLVDATAALVKEKGCEDLMVYISFGYSMCTRILEHFPDAQVQYLAWAESGAKSPEVLGMAGLAGADYSKSFLDWDYIKDAHDKGLVANVWTVDDEDEIMQYIGWGVDFITTNYPDLAKELCSKTWLSK